MIKKPKKSKSKPKSNAQVFTAIRTVIQPNFIIPEGLKLEVQQIMDGKRLLEALSDNSVALGIFDPEYRGILEQQNYGNEGERQKGRALLEQTSDNIINDCLKLFDKKVIPSGHVFLWIDKFILCSGSLQELLKDTSFVTVDLITWNKGKIGMGYRTRRKSEYLIILQKPPKKAKGAWTAHNIPDVWEEKPNKKHPHAKPILLQQKLIEATTAVGDLVVDPMAGSYSVMEAALATKRHFLGCDLVVFKENKDELSEKN